MERVNGQEAEKSFSVTSGLRLFSFFLSFCLSHEFLSQLPISMLLDSQCIAMSENIHFFHNTYTTAKGKLAHDMANPSRALTGMSACLSNT